ncbi:hypothetical protein N7492_002151 [Penicillium capsulatum]|uniref:PXA domain-containing protein n=1 Tax=Penicillium capsulatum TaxID=69766 RepID=A0A9W9IKW4_9EURO|nr:hypothetical protein N7492_002151 [Penicillium capsulatum]KAJ6123239.1 hypothetical protein N7512_005704 [Penicillium capsulatum]
MDHPSDDVASNPVPGLAASPSAPDRPSKPTAPSPSSKTPLDTALDFLSTSSNETLLGVFGLLGVATYIILGRIGLVLIGVALGVLLHASWEGPSHRNESEELRTPRKRRELALEVSNRLLDWPKRALPAETETENETSALVAPEDLSSADLEYATFRPATAAALRSLTDAVIQDYVKYWYQPILPSENTFPGSCRRTLTHFVTAVSSHLARKRTEDTFLQFLTNSSSIIIVFLNELAAAFAAGSSSADAQTVVEQYLESSPDSSLANVLSREQQQKKLSMIAQDILSGFLDSNAYKCPPVRDFLREVFSGVVLESTVTSLSRPEFINDWIIYLLQDGESELMHAIDAGVEGARNQGVSAPKDLNTSKETAVPSIESQTPQGDKATEDAIQEAKRLSALIASQDVQTGPSEPSTENAQSPESPPQEQNPVSNATPESPEVPVVPAPEEEPPERISLHGAQVMVDDSDAGNERAIIRSRPTWNYLLQVEPVSSHSTGWMVFRKYADFESLHEMLETVSRLNRVQGFQDQFPSLPTWKDQTRQDLARNLERYLQAAMRYEPLAETERMRRFLEKDRGDEASPAKSGFSFPNQAAFENMGKGVLGALTSAPKGVAGGGKAVFDGVAGVFGGGHNRKLTNNTADRQSLHRTSSSRETGSHELSRVDSASSSLALGDRSRNSEGGESPAVISSPTAPSLDLASTGQALKSPSPSVSGNSSNLATNEQDAWASESTLAQEGRTSSESVARAETNKAEDQELSSARNSTEAAKDVGTEAATPDVRRPQNPITADETQIAVELIFAVINELYTLSSAWNIRRTLLNAAKSYILRPGSPTLETIRTLLQDSMIESHTSDDALGEYLKKLRENALPTEAELKAWPEPPSEEEKTRIRDTARRLFVQRGIPQALTSVMGAAASREALEKIFDSLQVETVARGFVFSVMLQGLRVLTL